MTKLGVFTWFGFRLPVPERIRLIKEAGFETVLSWWDDSFADVEGCTKEKQAEMYRDAGLYVENAHLAFAEADGIWRDDLSGQSVFERHLRDLDEMAMNEIPSAVMHVTRTMNPPPFSQAGLDRFSALADRARNRGVKLALENVRRNDYLCRVLDAVDSPALGLCYDSGHDLLWSDAPYRLLGLYADRVFAVHLHDNHGLRDEHLAPGEGIADWAAIRQGLEQSSYGGSYTLECDSEEMAAIRTPSEHLRINYQGAARMLLT